MKTSAVFVLLLSWTIIHAQDPCRGRGAPAVFQANRIGALYLPQGEKFIDLEYNEYFKVPYTSEHSASTIFACAPWISGYINGEVRAACQKYLSVTGQDFNTGPLNPDAQIPVDLCGKFDHVWEISNENIFSHIADYETDHFIDDTIPSVFGWPAQGNKYFLRFNGFELPIEHKGGWAEFEDLNQNGNYDPDQGEYPIVKLKGHSYIPVEIMWMVFNDKGIHELTASNPLGIEIQLTVFGFNCLDNEVLNNALFNTYKVINQNAVAIDSLFFGLFTDYDLGCSEDDYMGCDSSRNTEFVYNKKALDGFSNGDCSTGQATYGEFPPVQSMTYLSHPLHSFIFEDRTLHPSVQGYFNFLNGLWEDGTPIIKHGDGYHQDTLYPVTRYLYNGDPRDSSQWSLYSSPKILDALTVSSVFIGKLPSHDSAVIETVYQFHQDSTLDNLEQIGYMQSNIDYLHEHLDDILSECTPTPYCMDDDCVWPGDFNRNGIADHFDILYWGVEKDAYGTSRDGRINWEGHAAEPWALELPDGFNAKHGDANGNGVVNDEDIERNLVHFLKTNYRYNPINLYPEGPEIVISATLFTGSGRISRVRLTAGTDIQNVLGLGYEIEYDTNLFVFNRMINFWSSDSNGLTYSLLKYMPSGNLANEDIRYASVQTDHKGITIPKDFLLQRDFGYMLSLKPGLTYDDLPDSIVIRLRNLIAIDPDGNDLHIGSEPLIIHKNQITGVLSPADEQVFIYPNPASHNLCVEGAHDISVEMINVQGQSFGKFVVGEGKPINVSAFPPGLYYVRAVSLGKTFKIIVY